MVELASRFRGCLLGLACGDAVGTAVEFSPPGSFAPVTDMIGGGPFRLPAGAWTDDTSMALCLASSLVELGRFDPADQMRRYCRWHEDGYLSSTGRCFDIGVTVSGALARFRQTGEPFSGRTEPGAAGNGCIMRLAPVPLFFYPHAAAAAFWAGESSRTTHGTRECVESCRLLAAMIGRALAGGDKRDVLFGHDPGGIESANVRSIAAGDYRTKPASAIRGTGYVIRCLEAAAWCFWKAQSFREAVLLAANLGDDADTTAAVCGQLAGAFYGEEGVPAEWLARLVMGDEIRSLADRLRLGERAVGASGWGGVRREIANRDLTLGCIPPPDVDWDVIALFALTYPGYQAQGSFEACAEIANARRDGTLTELRTCLFFEQRRWNSMGSSPSGEALAYIRGVLEKIRAKVAAGELDR
jgi:ADP-ribosyl-[dinitrogen reductase] hydrolase